MRKNLALAGFAAYLIVLFCLTLAFFRTPPAPRASRLNLVPLVGIARFLRVGGRGMVVNVLGNLAAFVPLGVLLPMLPGGVGSARRVAFVGFLLSLEIEALQLLSRQRTADVDDLILNTLGALLGYFAFARLNRSRLGLGEDRLLPSDDAIGDRVGLPDGPVGEFVHDVEHQAFHDRPQGACPGAPRLGAAGRSRGSASLVNNRVAPS